jgi:GH25 family lysozyme M1 (1,4-beta-N-acetylmuramidase)
VTRGLRIDGFDISHYQDQRIDWRKAHDHGAKFVFHKCTQGTSFVDPNYHERRIEHRHHGIRWGAYHFAEAEKNQGTAQARWFLKHAVLKKGNMLPALDLETNPNRLSEADMTEFVEDFFRECQRQLGTPRGIIYTPYRLGRTPGLHLRLWSARYSNVNARPPIPAPHKHYAIRQFSDGKFGVPRSLPGVGEVDLNHIRNGLEKALWKRRLTIH